MKTTLDLPDDLMTELKVRAARESRKLKDVMAEVLRRGLGSCAPCGKKSVRNIAPASVGEVLDEADLPEDRLGDMLDARGDRY